MPGGFHCARRHTEVTENMRKPNSRYEFWALAAFLITLTVVLTNGFTARIFAQEDEVDVFEQIEPIGYVLSEIMNNYVEEPDIDKVVEGALRGMMFSLDRHSAYIPPRNYSDMTEDTEGEFEGVGINIEVEESGAIVVIQPIPGSPAAKAGVLPGDIIYKIDDVRTDEMDIHEAARRIKGPKGTTVKLTMLRRGATPEGNVEELDFTIKRGKIPIESVKEARLFDGGVGYIRVSDFRKNTSDEMKEYIKELNDAGLRALILDLRWNPGGLLSASKEMCELFLPKGTLVTYTKGREGTSSSSDNIRLYTESRPIVPTDMPMVILVNDLTASSSEIVTGALQFHERAIVVGEKTYGKGSVQTIIPLRRPVNSALRLTTALYYSPADVTINGRGILPDIAIDMGSAEDRENWADRQLYIQLDESYRENPNQKDEMDHGVVNPPKKESETVEDLPLKKALEILRESSDFTYIIEKYHRDTTETQVAAAPGKDDEGS